MKRERFKRDSFPDNCVDWTNENVSFGARNYECLSKKRGTFWSRGVPGGVLPYIRYIGMCRPKGYGF